MLSKVNSIALRGLEGYLIEVQVDISSGMPCWEIVGLPDISVKEAKERGIKTAIGTGTRTENAHLILNKLDIAKYVDVLVTADDVKRHKPNPDTFEKAALKMDLKNYECLVFEDGQLGVRAAINGGFDCVEVKDDDFINYFEIDR